MQIKALRTSQLLQLAIGYKNHMYWKHTQSNNPVARGVRRYVFRQTQAPPPDVLRQ